MLTIDLHTGDEWKLLQAGDQSALLALYQHHYAGLINYGFKVCGDKDLSNDCVIKILLRLWDQRERLPDVTNVRAYLLTCLRHEIAHELQVNNTRNSQKNTDHLMQDMLQPSYEDVLIGMQANAELRKRLLRAFKVLSDREKQLLQMKFFDGMSYDEIASHCRISKRTAYNIIHSALKSLKKELWKNGMRVLPEYFPSLLFAAFLLAI